MSRSLYKNRDLEKLEPYEGKLSCTVLRGEEGSNALDLPDKRFLCRLSRLIGLSTIRLTGTADSCFSSGRKSCAIMAAAQAK